ncbi:putative von Willebrand factor, type A [Vibrio nigripulchritudo SFn27]|uniref:vWA domain-containing protein n=2 Tax=Vibrio nigripulchritudo TaxID=28173 RepID=UPI0003B1CF0A|nr:VWA domain-containing protein [Vibrio nigripulchritudo]CCN83412.1 putative von Willebrand factor, type A [Vibrio nigripulchritudo BLFn1]CCN88771.1 putative von Willebrand factor, type A [Vibrio nigripulchritudo SFn27]CCN95000.1 putative von Willebrand factor, type A [Vibrio nigripulchritudo ENn2]CCO41116.1 putative von Willebrand factor, type A [Vibrio nigripulchritudo SFn135]CCO52433.1 putative von Willebrand factor, type A [Vibrio nigripulchritudo Wn13]
MKLTKSYLSVAIALGLVTACTESVDNPRVEEVSNEVQIQDSTQSPKPEIEVEDMSLVLLESIQGGEVAFAAPSNRMAKTMIARPMPMLEPFPNAENRDNYLDSPSNGVVQVATSPLSTFSIDVDTGSYANVRSYLNMGQKPPSDAIREEAFINYFDYQYNTPDNQSQPFSVQSEVAPSPWNVERKLLRIAMKGYDIPKSERKSSNFVFLIDVSGSMGEPNKLPLLVQSLSMMTKELGKNDKVSLVTYAGQSAVVLEPTSGDNKQEILNALKQLQAGGGTYGESGIKMAYQQAQKGFIKGGINRVILATDGDFNVGETNMDTLKELITKERKNGVSLTTLGFGRGNYNDALMEQLANVGDGNHAYIDTLHEAKKVLLRQMSGTLQSIAHDVKIQVEFNPANVKEYRLIGYQNRLLKDEDFNNDAVDAGEIGAGHTVTALYELTLAGSKGQIDDLRYQSNQSKPSSDSLKDELVQVKVRYKLPGKSESILVKDTVLMKDVKAEFSQASSDFQFASAVAAFAQKLKDNNYLSSYGYEDIVKVANANKGADPFNYRGEFVRLVEIAEAL